jgi:DNA-binding SARP family transcriptional activator
MAADASSPADRLEFRILGPLEVLAGSVPVRLGGPRQRAVLAILLGHANEVVPADRLIDGVWDEPPETAANVLQGYVSQLRRTLGRDVIATRGRDYAIRLADGALDLHRFERLGAAAAAALGEGRPAEASAGLRSALSLWRGPALSDLLDVAGVARIADRLDELRDAALERRLEADLACGRDAEAAIELAALVAQHPLRERLRALQMRALYRSGRQAEALAAYRDARATLVDELGIEPGRELQELERAILAQDPALSARDGSAPAEAAPPALAPADATILVAALDPAALPALAALAEPLARAPRRELVLAATVASADALGPLARRVAELRAETAARGARVRAAAFTSRAPGADLVRLADEQEARLVIVEAPAAVLEDPQLVTVLDTAACDVAVAVAAGSPADGPVLVPFSGAAHDWAAVELGAELARALGRPIRLAGATVGPGGRDASRLLASASLVVQRGLGLDAEPLLLEPAPEALAGAARGAGVVVCGLTERWRREGLGRARRALATTAAVPVLLVRRGLRPGTLAPPESDTRFTWTVAAAAG